MKTDIKLIEKYSFKNYKPNKNAIPVIYKGTTYLSKIQACVLNGISRKQLEEYLKNNIEPTEIEPLDNEVL